MNTSFLLDTCANKNDKDIAIINNDEHINFIQCFTIVKQLEQYLFSLGIKKKQRVAILLPTNKEYILLFFAFLRMGTIIVPINTYFAEPEILSALDKVSPSFFITSEKYSYHLNIPTIHIENIPWSQFSTPTNIFPGAVNDTINIDQPATVVFTSGSSGTPKAVVHSFANHYYSAIGSNQHIPLLPQQKWLLSLPLYHVAGIAILFRCLVARATIVISNKNLLGEISKHQVSHISLVATQLHELLNKYNQSDFSSVQHILLGGSSFSSSMIREAVEKKLNIYTSYGLTEMSSQVATTPKITREQDKLTATILAHRKVKIAEDGQILVAGDTLCLGYMEQDNIISITDKDGWFATNDLGNINEKGNLQVFGRKDDMFISGGENIHPQEIEQQLCSIDSIVNAIVIPIHVPKYGFRPLAFILSNKELDKQKILTELRKKIASFKVPDYIFPWPENLVQQGIKINRKAFIEYARTLF